MALQKTYCSPPCHERKSKASESSFQVLRPNVGKFLHKMSLKADKELFLWRAFKYSNV